jgi:hypothetical protein
MIGPEPTDVGAQGDHEPPTFAHHEKVLAGFEDLFAWFQTPDIIVENLIKCATLARNSVILLSGTYGTGKNQLVSLIRHLFFCRDSDATGQPADRNGRYDAWKVTCSQDITPHDVLYYLDLGRLQQGVESVTPRPLVGARLKYINEVQRATPLLHNALLSLLSEHEVTYRDQIFSSPDFICFLDRNPEDTGSDRIPGAFLDRVDCSIEIPAIGFDGAMTLQARKLSSGHAQWDDLTMSIEPRCTPEMMAVVWDDVLRVDVPERVLALANMVGFSFRVCVAADRTVVHPDFRLDCSRCEFKAEICSHVEGPPPAYRFIESGLRIAQARAWLNGKSVVAPEDFYFALPFVAGHRVKLRPELRGQYAHAQEWIMDDAWQTIRRKLPTWTEALDMALDGGRDQMARLHDIARNDLVVRELDGGGDWKARR